VGSGGIERDGWCGVARKTAGRLLREKERVCASREGREERKEEREVKR